jgi:hypothetical protein
VAPRRLVGIVVWLAAVPVGLYQLFGDTGAFLGLISTSLVWTLSDIYLERRFDRRQQGTSEGAGSTAPT